MNITATHVLHGPPERVWEALNDPAVLARAIPGCEEVSAVSDGAYDVRGRIHVASVAGALDGRVEVVEQDAPHTATLRVSGGGEPGKVEATGVVRLTGGDDGTTTVEFDADVQVDGALGGVGRRVLLSEARRSADAFFAAVDRHLTGERVATAPDLTAAETDTEAVDAAIPARPAEPAPRVTAEQLAAVERPVTSERRDMAEESAAAPPRLKGGVPLIRRLPDLLGGALAGAAVTLVAVRLARRGSR